MGIVEGLLALTFSTWLVVSIGAQLGDRFAERLGRLDLLGLIPRWTFFAPRPGVHDIHLLYRDRLSDGTVTPLALVNTIHGRRWYHALWNPYKARNKVVLDVMMSLGRQYIEMEKQQVDRRLVLLYPSYLMALHLVMREPIPEQAVARQFVLARTQAARAEERAIIMASEFHRTAGVPLDRSTTA